MKVGIMQPYFFPYVGYFSLIEYSDLFIFFDTPQYISHGWVNRNRILDSNKNLVYINVPIKKANRETPINKIEISSNSAWKDKIFGQLTAYKRRAPFFKDIEEFLHGIIDNYYGSSLSELNIYSIKAICEKIGLKREFDVFSKMNLIINQVSAPDEWALNITKALGGDVYVNPPGGKSFFDKIKYEENNIKLKFLTSNLKKYVQRIGYFEPGLSIIDVMMFCDDKEVMDIIMDYELE